MKTLPVLPLSSRLSFSHGVNTQEPLRPPRRDQDFVTACLSTPVGDVPQVSSRLFWPDRWGAIKARCGVGRMHYTVDPGLYALGNPHADSPVLVSANYKLSFDRLRSSLPGYHLWILVLDTQGINVWCAAGKGSFGTEELVRRIAASRLKEVVNHRFLILPQLGAPGVAAHLVKKLSGFHVYYGPIKAEDLPAYLDAGMKATAEMRLKTFPLSERAALIPIELLATIKPTLVIAPALFLLCGLGGSGDFWTNALQDGAFALAAFLSAVLGGAVLHPLLLPYLPGRAFTTKGLWLGAIVAVIMLWLREPDLNLWTGRLEVLAWLMMIPAVTGYLAMNFTGASTYTSPSGVRKEMHWALPTEIGLAAGGLVFWITSRVIA